MYKRRLVTCRESSGTRCFEGEYEVSSCGRVPSLDRLVPHRRGRPVRVAGRVLALTHRPNENERTGEPAAAVRVALSHDGRRLDRSVRRLV